MVKSGTLSTSVWAQFGLGTKSRDADVPSAPLRVSEDAQAKSIEQKAANLGEFNRQNRDRLPERPSTSAGPASTGSSSFTQRKNAHKRETKDDLHFNPLAVHGRGTTFYNFPLPGSLPTPASSPTSPSPSVHESSLARPSTPDSMEITPAPALTSADTMNVPQGEIGMALGSPSHAPAAWQEHSVQTYIRHESPDQMDGSVDGSWDNQPRPKPSRWKVFGGIFGGTKKAQPAFYQLQPEVTEQPGSDHVQDPASSEKRPKSRGRGWSNSTRRKNKPEMSRSNTVPTSFDMSGGRAMTGTPEITLEGGPLIENASRFAQKGAGLLDVDIPSTQMERYSIMFSGVLQKPQQTSSSSSLLARRQATLDKLKTVNEALASKEQEIEAKSRLLLSRRATSPSGMKTQSPAFSLFPNTPSRIRDQSPSSRHHPSGSLQRSNTSPAALSPSRPSFAPGPENEAHARLMARDHGRTSLEKRREGQESRAGQLKTDSGRPSTASPTPKPPQWSSEDSHLSLDDSDDEEVEAEKFHDLAPMKPRILEPDWQIINPPHTTAPSASGSSTSGSGSNHSHAASTSSSISTPPSTGTGLPAKPNMPSPPLASSISPKGQAQARAIAATVPRIPMSRSRSATTTTTTTTIIPNRSPQPAPAEAIDSPTLHPEPIRSLSSTISPSTAQASSKSQSQPQFKPRPPLSSDADSENEERLKSLADVSIARQISVSRQQRQLLVPIKTSLKSASSSGSLRGRSPGSGSQVNVNKVASPLAAVAAAAQEERERGASPLTRNAPAKEKGEEEKVKERLVEAIKPSTPTLVVVGDKEEKWDGATQQLKSANAGLGERRRLLAANKHTHANAMGEITVGIESAMIRGERAIRERELRDLQNRKSERVVVERISTDS